MPRLIEPEAGDPITLDELVDALDADPFDPRDEEALCARGPLLARLGRNRDFLADLAIDELKQRCDGQAAGNAYGAQVFLLRPPNGRYVLRANFWPAPGDAVLRASGPAPFFYDLPHDHNFSFLTVGYLGPGYWSDYFEFDREAVTGLPREHAGLRFVERARLDPGKLMLYRAHRDIHVQLPPDAFSVSLNILAYDLAQPWREQFRFDVAAGAIGEGLTTTPSEALLSLAVHLSEDGADLAHHFLSRHPNSRMRATALAALASTEPEPHARAALFEEAACSPDAYLAGHARHRLAMMERDFVRIGAV